MNERYLEQVRWRRRRRGDANVSCIGCGATFPDGDGPVHRYMESSPGCWAAYGEILAREYSDPRYLSVHRLTVDSYAVQHPGRSSAQSIQSVALHLISLSLVLDHGVSPESATEALRRCSRSKDSFVWLDPPIHRGGITVADVRSADLPDTHIARVWDWARGAWAAWSPYHDTIGAWVGLYGLLPTGSS